MQTHVRAVSLDGGRTMVGIELVVCWRAALHASVTNSAPAWDHRDEATQAVGARPEATAETHLSLDSSSLMFYSGPDPPLQHRDDQRQPWLTVAPTCLG